MKFGQVMAFPKAESFGLSVAGATADPQCPTSVNHCHQLGICLALAVGTFSPKTQSKEPGGNPNPAECIGLGRAMSLDLDPKSNSNPDPDLKPDPDPIITTLILPLSLISKLCFPFLFIR